MKKSLFFYQSKFSEDINILLKSIQPIAYRWRIRYIVKIVSVRWSEWSI